MAGSTARPIIIRAGSGLGDALYLQPVVRHLVEQGKIVEVCNDWPDVFRPLWGRIVISEFRRKGVNTIAHYVRGKETKGTTQFEDCCIAAGIKPPVEFRLDWQPVSAGLISMLRRHRKPIIAVALPRFPMNRKDGFGEELLPDCRRIEEAILFLRRKGATIVQVGSGDPLYKFQGIDVDLANKTTVTDLLDVAWGCDGFLGYCSFFVPLAESLNKPALFVWSRRGTHSRKPFIRTVTPTKVLHRSSSKAVFDDESREEIERHANSLLVAPRTPALV